MKVFIAWTADGTNQEIQRAAMTNEVESVRRLNQAVDHGNEVWRSWVVTQGGSIVSMAGTSGRAEVPAENLAALPRFKEQFAGAVGADVSVGVGTKLAEADRALMVASKCRGGNQIVLYTPDIETELKASQTQEPTDGLAKADGPNALQAPAMVEGSAAGFKGASPPSPPATDKPDVEASEHSQGEAAQSLVENQPPPVESTHSVKDFEDLFHAAASAEVQKGVAQQQGQQSPSAADPDEQLKSRLVQILQVLKGQAPVMEQIKDTAPDTYAAVVGLTQLVITMAKRLNGEPGHESPRELEDRARSQAQIQIPIQSDESDDSNEDAKKSEKKFKLEGDALIEVDPKTGKSLGKGPVNKQELSETEPEWHDCDEFGHVWGDGPTSEHCLLCGSGKGEIEELQKSEAGLQERIGHLVSTTGGSTWQLPARTTSGLRVAGVKPGFVVVTPDQHDLRQWRATIVSASGQPTTYKVAADHAGALLLAHRAGANLLGDPHKVAPMKVSKASLNPGAGSKAPAIHHHVLLPVGTHFDPGPNATRHVGKIKVLHPETQKQGWVQARAGMVLSEDNHPISAKNPKGK